MSIDSIIITFAPIYTSPYFWYVIGTAIVALFLAMLNRYYNIVNVTFSLLINTALIVMIPPILASPFATAIAVGLLIPVANLSFSLPSMKSGKTVTIALAVVAVLLYVLTTNELSNAIIVTLVNSLLPYIEHIVPFTVALLISRTFGNAIAFRIKQIQENLLIEN